MNCDAYIFGELSEGYSQYPSDGSSNIFKSIFTQCVAPSQLIIHREDGLMYYVYVRKFTDKSWIGLGVVINGFYFTEINLLFTLFEKKIECLAEDGVLVSYTPNGDLSTKISSFKLEEGYVLNFLNVLQKEIKDIKYIKKLPGVDYSVSINSQNILNVNDDNSIIIESSYTFGTTIVLKQENYDTIRSTSYRNTLRQLNIQNETLEEEVRKLKETNKKILNQKKQFKKVVFLFLILILSCFGLYFLYINLSDTQDKLETANKDILEKDLLLREKDTNILNLRDSIVTLKRKIKSIDEERNSLNAAIKEIGIHYPFIVTSCNVNSGMFKFDYYCPENISVDITLKAINVTKSGVVTYNYSLLLEKGYGENSLLFDSKLDTTYYYYVVLIYKGQVIAGKYW